MRSGYLFAGVVLGAACIIFAGCNPSSFGGGGGGGGNPTPTPPIPAGDYYVNGGIGPTNEVFGFSTAPIVSGGQPSGLPSQPYSVTNGNDGSSGAPFGMALAGNYLYVVNSNSATISAFLVKPDGSLTTPALAAVPTGGKSPSGICIDPADQFLVVANTASNQIDSFMISAGVLTHASTGATMLTSPIDCAFSTNSKTVYVSNSMGGTGVTSYSVGVTGTLSSPQSYPIQTDDFRGIVVSGGVGGAVFAATPNGNGVGVFQIASGGGLLPGVLTQTAFGPIGLALSPNGKYLYVAAAAARAVDAYSVNGLSLTRIGGPYQILTTGLSYVAVNPAGNLLVALSVVDKAVTPFAITGNGTLGFPPSPEYVVGGANAAEAIVAR